MKNPFDKDADRWARLHCFLEIAVSGLVIVTLIIAVLAAITGFAFGQERQQWTTGQVIVLNAGCQTEADARLLSESVALRGDEAYVEIMIDPSSTCFSRQFGNIPFIPVTLVDKTWQVTHLNGHVFQFWTAVDQYGRVGYVWNLISEPKKEEGTDA